MTKDLSVRQFTERLESRLNEMSVQDLRAWVREAAGDLPPEKRQGFLNSLSAAVDTPTNKSKAASLPGEIAALRRKLEAAMDEEPEWGYGDDEEMNCFEGLVPELERLFGRARALFRKSDFKAAAEAYRALFELSVTDDDYGRSMGLPEGLDAGEERARYLRSVVERRGSDRGRALLSAWGHLTDREEVRLVDVFEITSAPVPNQDALLDEMIPLLEEQGDDACDAWLRQATRIRFGADGLERLARQSNGRRPEAWVDWVAAVAEAGNAHRTAHAANEALKNLPARLSLRAQVAEHAFQAAVESRDAERALAARWEVFCAARSIRSLLDLWDAAGQARSEWMAHAAAESLQRLPGSARESYVGPLGNPMAGTDPDKWPFEPDDGSRIFGWSRAEFYIEASGKLTSLANLLAGDWKSAWKTATGEKVLGWSFWESSQSLVVPGFLARLSGAPEQPLPPAVNGLWRAALCGADDSVFESDNDPSEADRRLTGRLAQVLGESMKSWTLDSATASDVVQLALRRVDAIVGEKHRGAYERAALLTIAVTEGLVRQGKPEESQKLLQSVIDRHRRKYAFTGEVKGVKDRLALD